MSLDVAGASRDACRVFSCGRGVSRRQLCLEMRQSRLETPSVSLDVVGVSRDAERVSRRGMGVLRRHIGFFCQNRWQVNGMAVYLRARRGFRCLSLPQPYWQCVQSLGTGREAIPGQLYTVAVTKSPPGQRPRKGARTAEFMMTRPLYGRRTSFKPSHTSPDIIR